MIKIKVIIIIIIIFSISFFSSSESSHESIDIRIEQAMVSWWLIINVFVGVSVVVVLLLMLLCCCWCWCCSFCQLWCRHIDTVKIWDLDKINFATVLGWSQFQPPQKLLLTFKLTNTSGADPTKLSFFRFSDFGC